MRAPTTRQKTESGGISIEVITISATCAGAFEVPLSELANPGAHAYRGPWRIPADKLPPGLGSLTIGQLLSRYQHKAQA